MLYEPVIYVYIQKIYIKTGSQPTYLEEFIYKNLKFENSWSGSDLKGFSSEICSTECLKGRGAEIVSWF
jgi:hypothetical protein